MNRSEAIKNFLTKRAPKDLAELYNIDMECQVNVAQDAGRLVAGEYKGRQWRAWTDDIQTWKPFRIPYNAATEPSYEDVPIRYDLAEHAEGIGMTGWDWKARLSRWVAYDFDAISGHSDKHAKKLDASALQQVADESQKIEWVTTRRSTSGRGIHLYVFLATPVVTANHTEHAALARAILGQLSALTRYDFSTSVDSCGGNMWVWHRKMQGTNGLELVKAGIPLVDVPANWAQHVDVVIGKRKKVVIHNEDDDELQELSGTQTKVALDDEHKTLLDYLKNINANWWWDKDHHMMVTNTYALARAHKDLSYKGDFKTLAKGDDEQNCFAWPMRKGSWVVRRYTRGVAEETTWSQDMSGWTRCYLNREQDFASAAIAHGGSELPKGGYRFSEASVATRMAFKLGAPFELPRQFETRAASVREIKDGRLVMEIVKESSDTQPTGWILEKGKWLKVFKCTRIATQEPEVENHDDQIRHVVNLVRDDAGWMVKTSGSWGTQRIAHVAMLLESLGVKRVNPVLGNCVSRPWHLVSIPFEVEYPGDRRWNRGAPQFRFAPSLQDDVPHPTWDKVFRHCGQALDEAVSLDSWCSVNGIHTGAEYLKCWVASLLQQPYSPLPYLFFYGPQNSGKSIFHEAISLLITSGYMKADQALLNAGGFNGELAKTVLAVVEETDLGGGKNVQAYNRIKEWVTGLQVALHIKRETPYLIPNTTHWVQCANNARACPIFPGDTRITMCYVDSLSPIDMIPKRLMLDQLEREGPNMLADLLKLEIPASNDRLNLPVLNTKDKVDVQDSNKTPVETFIDECCHKVSGQTIRWSEYYDRFIVWLEPQEQSKWTKVKFLQAQPMNIEHGRATFDNNQKHVINLCFSRSMPAKALLTVKEGKIMEATDA